MISVCLTDVLSVSSIVSIVPPSLSASCVLRPAHGAQSTFLKDWARSQTSQTLIVIISTSVKSVKIGAMGAKHSKRRGLSKDDLEYLLGGS